MYKLTCVWTNLWPNFSRDTLTRTLAFIPYLINGRISKYHHKFDVREEMDQPDNREVRYKPLRNTSM